MAEQSLGRPVPAASAVIVGDTPHDIDCGRACAARTVGVATGRFTAAQLRDAGADFVLDDLADQAPLLRFLLDGRATGG
jgi:phosphoglycolate phosphatase-like HAD superfamily hydrolase